MAKTWFPFLARSALFLWWSNILGYLPLPTNSQEKFNLFGAHIPAFALYAATANISVPLVLALVVFVAFNVAASARRPDRVCQGPGPGRRARRDACC